MVDNIRVNNKNVKKKKKNTRCNEYKVTGFLCALMERLEMHSMLFLSRGM